MRRALFTGLLLAALGIAPAAQGALAEFNSRSLGVQTRVIDDLGIADFDGDGDHDIYSANHSDPSTFFRNDGAWAFIDIQGTLGFDQTPDAPSWNQLADAPDMSQPGLYIWAGWDYIEIRSTDPGAVAAGRLSLYSPVEATVSGGAAVAVVQGQGNPPPTDARFTIPDGGRAILRYTTPGHSFESTILSVDDAYPRDRVHLGAAGETAPERTVELNLRDRHAMVWGQFDSGIAPDVLIVRGGLKQSIFAVDRRPSDELFISGDGGFSDRAVALGLGEQVCSGREARQVDLGAGDSAELLIACRSSFPRIYRRGLFGFTARDEALPRQMKSASWYLPFDLGAGTGRVLIIRRESKVHLVRVSHRRWSLVQSVKLRTEDRSGRNHKRIARGDIDGDGDMDAFVPDPRGSTLLINRDGQLVARPPESRGLPGSSRSAAMVDFDLDGRLDLHLLPEGMFRQRTRNRFVAHGDPEARGIDDPADLSESWADLDGDLDLDGLIGQQPQGTGIWKVRALENVGVTGNGLAVHAAGRIENSVALGARVKVFTEDERLVGWIGQNNTNSYGQGNYDLVFGLGAAETAQRVVVDWPDGSTSVRRNIPAGSHLTVLQQR